MQFNALNGLNGDIGDDIPEDGAVLPAPVASESVVDAAPDTSLVPGEVPNGSAASVGALLEHGADFFNHDKDNDMSYFVKLQRADGVETTLWGKDLDRALLDSGASINDVIFLTREGKEDVQVTEKIRDEEGNVIGTQPKEAYFTRWIVGKVSELDLMMAQATADASPSPNAEPLTAPTEVTSTALPLDDSIDLNYGSFDDMLAIAAGETKVVPGDAAASIATPTESVSAFTSSKGLKLGALGRDRNFKALDFNVDPDLEDDLLDGIHQVVPNGSDLSAGAGPSGAGAVPPAAGAPGAPQQMIAGPASAGSLGDTIGRGVAAGISMPFIAMASAAKHLSKVFGQAKAGAQVVDGPSAGQSAMAGKIPPSLSTLVSRSPEKITNWKARRIEKAGAAVISTIDEIKATPEYLVYEESVQKHAADLSVSPDDVIGSLSDPGLATVREKMDSLWAAHPDLIERYRDV